MAERTQHREFPSTAQCIICILMIVCCWGCRVFPESMFELAPESRLPRWFTLPKGLSRADVTVSMYCYVGPLGRSSTFWLLDKHGNALAKVHAVTEGLKPHYLGTEAYEIETTNGITEVIEFKQMEPIFYVSDGPSMTDKPGLADSPNRPPTQN